VLVIVDPESDLVLWHAPQISDRDRELLDSAKQDGNKTVTLRCDTGNRLAETLGQMLLAIGQCQTHVSMRAVRKASQADFIHSIRTQREPDAAIDTFQDHLDQAKWQEVMKLIAVKGHTDPSVDRRLNELVTAASTEVNLRFLAAQMRYWIETKERAGKVSQEEQFPLELENATRLLELAPRPHRHLRIVARLIHCAALLAPLASGDYALYAQGVIHAQRGEVLESVRVYRLRHQNLVRLVAVYRRGYRLVTLGLSKPSAFGLPFACARFIASMRPLTSRLFLSGHPEAARGFRESLRNVSTRASALAQEVGNLPHAALSVLNFSLLVDQNDVRDIRQMGDFVRAQLNAFEDQKFKESALQTYGETEQRTLALAKNWTPPSEVPPIDETMKVFRDTLKRYGL